MGKEYCRVCREKLKKGSKKSLQPKYSGTQPKIKKYIEILCRLKELEEEILQDRIKTNPPLPKFGELKVVPNSEDENQVTILRTLENEAEILDYANEWSFHNYTPRSIDPLPTQKSTVLQYIPEESILTYPVLYDYKGLIEITELDLVPKPTIINKKEWQQIKMNIIPDKLLLKTNIPIKEE